MAATGGLAEVTAELPGTTAPDHEARLPAGRLASAAHRRRATGWYLLGISLTALVMLGVHHTATAAIGTPLGHSRGFVRVTIVLAPASFILLAGLAVRDRPRASDLPHLLSSVWTDPPGAWAAGVLGALLATPVLGLYAPVLLGDADSARLVAAASYVRTHGIDFLLETQDNFGPHLVVGPAVALGGLAGAKLVALVSIQVLAGVTCFVTYRITRSMVGAAAATLALVAIPALVDRGGYVPMYPTMLALGYLGGWLAYLAITQPDRWWLAGAAGASLALAPEAQGVGQLFLVAPVLLLVFAPTLSTGLAVCGRIYLFAILAMIPRIAVNVSVGGLENMTSYRTDYWITEGYVREIQSGFWNYPGIDEPLGEYLSRLPWRFTHSLGPQGYVVLALALVAWFGFCRGRGRLFVLAVVGFMVLAVSVKQVPPFPRYYSPLWPGLAVLVGVAVGRLAQRASRVARALAIGLVPLLALLAGSTLASAVHGQDDARSLVNEGPYRELAAVISDDKGVIGARSHSLVNVTADIPTWGGQFLAEDEYATYLTWPSDDAVIEVMDRHDIGWVLIHPSVALETDYHDTWLIPHHGVPARHVERVATSTNFCRMADVAGCVLYRLGGCPGDA